jgi:hypothetical protein
MGRRTKRRREARSVQEALGKVGFIFKVEFVIAFFELLSCSKKKKVFPNEIHCL